MATVKKSTPVLLVDAIEPSLVFWKALGFEVQIQVPHENRLGFVAISNGRVELMYQSFDSVAADISELAIKLRGHHSTLFVEVDSLELAVESVAQAPVFMQRRTTFYGANEIGVIEPGGHYVTLAEFNAEPDSN